MKALVCVLLLLESLVFVIQQVDGELSENEVSSADRREISDAEVLPDYKCFADIHAALRELTATVTEERANSRALETRLRDAERRAEQQELILEELSRRNDALSNLTLSQAEVLRMENRKREIAFSASLMQSTSGNIGPFTTDITLIYRNVFTNVGNAYNPITGIFTAPLKGVYVFRVSIYGPASQSTPSTVSIIKNGQIAVTAHAQQAQNVVNSSNGVVLLLDVGDVVFVRLLANRRISDSQNNHNTFSGFLLFPSREQEPCNM